MNIEESIEILKNMILMPDGWIIGKDYKGNLEFIGCLEGQEAIETLLTAYEKEKEKNKELTDEYLVQRDLINPDFLKDYIHKDKIKAKIEEVDKQEKEVLKGTKGQDRYAIKQEYMHKRSALQSLLEKE